MMNIAKIIPLLLATGHFWSNWAPCIGKNDIYGSTWRPLANIQTVYFPASPLAANSPHP